ncbi:MAG TPA: uracil-DNA glycosylase [Terriglobales bacterium]|nr:uracil-DNA glycosylase [Terriglobales bacterium]
MPSKLDPETRRALADRVQYYREMGVYDFYRREVTEHMLSDLTAEPTASATGDPAAADVQTAEAPSLDRSAALRAIREEIGECTRCPLYMQGRKQIVFGVGNPDAEIMFIGEAPGADEDEQGEPFVGRAGQLLNNMIKAMGISREDVYIANVIKCRPPGNRTPEPAECAVCSPFLLKQIDVIKPKAIVALGAVAAKTLLGVNQTMAEMRGQWHDFRGYPLAVTYHPAYLLRDPRQKVHTWHDLQMVMKRLGMAMPQKSGE